MAGKDKSLHPGGRFLKPGEFDALCAEKAATGDEGSTATLTQSDIAALRKYLKETEELSSSMPEHLTSEQWDEFFSLLDGSGEVPEKYRDLVRAEHTTDRSTGKPATTYTEAAWEDWHKKETELNERYRATILKALRYALVHDGEAAGKQQVADLLSSLVDAPTVTVESIRSLDFPLDKVNATVWKLLEETKAGGQLAFGIGVENPEDKRAGKEISIIYGIEFGELEELENVKITRKLEPYDKRVYIAIGAIYNTGQDYMSYQQIYNAMRFKGRAGASDLKKIHAAVSKMSGAKIYVDNMDEANAYNYTLFRYDGSLLPMERATALINGQYAESVIHVFREPPMLTLARERKQITTIERRLLASPLSMTNGNIQLEDYLIERISHMKNGKSQCKMLFETIYKNAGITQTKQKQRAWAKIEKLLNHYVECGFISGFEKEKDGVRIVL